MYLFLHDMLAVVLTSIASILLFDVYLAIYTSMVRKEND